MPVSDFFLILLSSVLVSSQKNFGAIGSEIPKNRRPKEEEFCSEFLDVSTLNQEPVRSRDSPLKKDPEALSFKWTFWYDCTSSQKKVSRKDYLSTLNRLATVSTLPAFFGEWRKIYSKLLSPPQIESNIRFFRDNILPMWEDPSNSNGGKWVVVFRQRPSQKTTQMLQSLLVSMMIGDLGHENDLCGAVLSIRTWGYMYTLWNKNSENQAQIEEISQKLAEVFQTPKIKYQSHKDAIQKTSHEARQQKEAEMKQKKAAKKSVKEKENQHNNSIQPNQVSPSNKKSQTAKQQTKAGTPSNQEPASREESPSKPEDTVEPPVANSESPQETHLNAGYVSSDSESTDPAISSVEAEGNQSIVPSSAQEVLSTKNQKKREQVIPPAESTNPMQIVCKKEGFQLQSMMPMIGTVFFSGIALALSAYFFD